MKRLTKFRENKVTESIDTNQLNKGDKISIDHKTHGRIEVEVTSIRGNNIFWKNSELGIMGSIGADKADEIEKTVKPNVSPKSLKDLKVGDTVYKLMTRYNPQLKNGVYYSFYKDVITKVTGKKIMIDDDKYDRETGEKLNPKPAVYGQAYYSIMTEEEAIKTAKELKDKGQSVRGMD